MITCIITCTHTWQLTRIYLGDPGAKGERGRDGADGAKGDNGEKGIPGDVGDPGSDGIGKSLQVYHYKIEQHSIGLRLCHVYGYV